MKRLRLPLLCALVTIAFARPAPAAEKPFFGTWKLNPAKSQLTGDTMTFSALRGGKVRFTGSGQTYAFTPDGKTRVGPMRRKVAWTHPDDRSWRAAWFGKKEPLWVETLEVAPDGKTLTDTIKGKRADGTAFEDSTVYERTAGRGASLMGTWRSSRAEVAGFQTISLSARGQDGIVYAEVDFKNTCKAHLDGADYAFKGPTVPPGMTLSFRPKGDRLLHVVQKQSGVPLFHGKMTVDEDGKTLTWDWVATSVNEPMKAVFERQ